MICGVGRRGDTAAVLDDSRERRDLVRGHGVDERVHAAGVFPAYGGDEAIPGREHVACAQGAQVLLALGPSWRPDARTGCPGEWYGDPAGRTHGKDGVAGGRSSASTVMIAVQAVSAAAPAAAVSMWAGLRVSVCPPVTTSSAQAPSRTVSHRRPPPR
ncbi:hypothetical protein K4749_05055 [Streptomyces sp. TRM72054]|uniref:hypothetical protein n=1 Tax=Streptomyces sp. TRM72054 TaxID=2870562 RepID=UPI001C8B9444|nr:hypothetical protein [Streptomyces sp. TRM72054]MBX9392967.1 hypothetical protein [Streptomyces sp. TRM72054]